MYWGAADYPQGGTCMNGRVWTNQIRGCDGEITENIEGGRESYFRGCMQLRVVFCAVFLLVNHSSEFLSYSRHPQSGALFLSLQLWLSFRMKCSRRIQAVGQLVICCRFMWWLYFENMVCENWVPHTANTTSQIQRPWAGECLGKLCTSIWGRCAKAT